MMSVAPSISDIPSSERWRSTINPEPVLLSWSGGKDSALALDRLRRDPAFAVAGLLTTVTADFERISIHGVRRELLHRQSNALRLPLHEIRVDPGCSNADYEAAWAKALPSLPAEMAAARCIAFGDLFLADVREYREKLTARFGFRPIFPVWGEHTRHFAQEIIHRGFKARLVCVDTYALDASFVGRDYDADLLAALPPEIDACGERGEFHTFVSDGPGFDSSVGYRVGETVLREDRFAFSDLMPDEVLQNIQVV